MLLLVDHEGGLFHVRQEVRQVSKILQPSSGSSRILDAWWIVD